MILVIALLTISIARIYMLLLFVAFFMNISSEVRLLSVMTFWNFDMLSSIDSSDLYMRRVVNNGILISLYQLRRHNNFGSSSTLLSVCEI